jgi:hypothetical protein
MKPEAVIERSLVGSAEPQAARSERERAASQMKDLSCHLPAKWAL